MFTGIIEEIGKVTSIQKSRLSAQIGIACRRIPEDMHIGDSIAVNGVCLTVTAFDQNGFHADVMHETLDRSGLGVLQIDSSVNLERAMPAIGRFGGHIVSGHIDGTGTICDIRKDGIAIWFTIAAPPELMQLIVEKGSIAIDGISLTVAKTEQDRFCVSIIPHTAGNTILPEKRKGDTVNLETDIIGKYAAKLLHPKTEPKHSGITLEQLAENGFM